MNQAIASQKIWGRAQKTIIEESKFTLEVTDLDPEKIVFKKEIVTSSVKLRNIDAEWWLTVGPSKTEVTNIPQPYGYPPEQSSVDILPIKFHMRQNKVLDLANAKFSINIVAPGVFHPNYSDTWDKVMMIPSSWVPHIKLSASLRNLAITVTFKVEREEEASIRSQFQNPVDCHNEILHNHAKMLTDSTFADFTFVVQGKEFKVHKNTLAAASPVFERMFLSNMKESRENSCKIENIDQQTFQSLLEYIYEAKLPNDLGKVAKTLGEAADYYGLTRLKEICGQNLHFHLSTENAVELYTWAYTFGLSELKKDAWEIVKRDVLKINFRIKEEPVSPKVLQEMIAAKEKEKEYWKSFDADAPIVRAGKRKLEQSEQSEIVRNAFTTFANETQEIFTNLSHKIEKRCEEFEALQARSSAEQEVLSKQLEDNIAVLESSAAALTYFLTKL